MSVHILYSALILADCTQWKQPKNLGAYPKWPYCNRRPDDGQTSYMYLVNQLPPADMPPHVCSSGRVLRHDSAGIICADYTQGDEYAGSCTDAQCCAEGICSAYTCTKLGWTLKSTASSISCPYFPCNDFTCCEAPSTAPRHHAQGIIFTDRDPQRFSFGGEATVVRAADEADITQYNIYWGFAKTVRKVPSCGLKNPVSWEQFKFVDDARLFKSLPATGCDITFTIAMGTPPNVRCPITLDRRDKTTQANDPCNPHYWVVVAAKGTVEKSFSDQAQQIGPRHPISDYESEYNLPCAEGGITYGHDLPGPDDVVLGTWNGVNSAAACAQLCRDYTGSPPCRYWTWAYPTGGFTAKSCWIESQVLQKAHYGVRVVGPAVCPTPDGMPPTGKERPRCDRWVRLPNMAPFDDANRGAWTEKGYLHAMRPNLPDVPLGPYSNAEECQAICDMDVLCVGFVFMKKDPTDKYFHHCIMIHHDPGTRKATRYYDMWLCSRAGMAPIVSGYTFQARPFGYKMCSGGTQISASPVGDHDCCASKCSDDTSCVVFTFRHTDRVCELYSACATLVNVNKVAGCAFESCYEEYGMATYKKDAPMMEIVDRWPKVGGYSGVPTFVQTAGIPEGTSIYCALQRTNVAKPNNVAEIKAKVHFTASVVGGVAGMMITKRPEGWSITDAEDYRLRCAADNMASFGLPAFVQLALATEVPSGYSEIVAANGNTGWCRGPGNCIHGYIADTSLKPYSVQSCSARCDSDSNCIAFQRRSSDGQCGIATPRSGCTYYTHIQADPLVRCFNRKTSYTHSIGNDRCSARCEGTCNWVRRMGEYERNYFLSPDKPCSVTDAPPTAEPTAVPTVAPPTAVPTAVPTDAPDTVAPDTPAPDTPAPDTPAPDTTAPDTPAPDTLAPDTPAPDTIAPDTPAPDTTVPGIPITPAPSTPAPSTPAPDTPAPDTPAPDTLAPDTPAPDTLAPDTPAPDTIAPDTPAPDTTVPGIPITPAPSTPAPSTPAPDTTAPDTPAPDTPAPDTPAPDTPAPDTPAPDTPAPDTPAPDTPAPDTPAPDTPAPDTPAPDTPAPDTLAPDTPAPDTIAPDTPAPGTTVPGIPITPASSTPAPSTPAPDTTAPDTPAPSTPAPDTPAPDTPAPDTPAPDTTVPGIPITPAPSTPAPSTPAPDTPAPTTPAPFTPAPDTTVPGIPITPAPDTPEPPTTAPGTPGTSVPGIPITPAPDTPEPPTTAPGTPGTSVPDTSAPVTPAPDTNAPAPPSSSAPLTPTPTFPPTMRPATTAAPTFPPLAPTPLPTPVPTVAITPRPTVSPEQTETPRLSTSEPVPIPTPVPTDTAQPTGSPTGGPRATAIPTRTPFVETRFPRWSFLYEENASGRVVKHYLWPYILSGTIFTTVLVLGMVGVAVLGLVGQGAASWVEVVV